MSRAPASLCRRAGRGAAGDPGSGREWREPRGATPGPARARGGPGESGAITAASPVTRHVTPSARSPASPAPPPPRRPRDTRAGGRPISPAPPRARRASLATLAPPASAGRKGGADTRRRPSPRARLYPRRRTRAGDSHRKDDDEDGEGPYGRPRTLGRPMDEMTGTYPFRRVRETSLPL